jgi:hypothetical protein
MEILFAFFGMPGPMELLIILAILLVVVGFPTIVILVLVFWVVPWERRARHRRLSSGKAPTDPKDPKCPPENPPL